MAVRAADIGVERAAHADAHARSHAVQFYERDDELAEAVCRYLTGSLRSGGVAVVIATKPHRRAFAAGLQAAGLDPRRLRRETRLVMLDAAETLASFMPGGAFDRGAFDRVIGSTIRSAVATGTPVHAFGEMVALLWGAGDVVAAVELEKLWNELAEELPFSLLCAYPSAMVSGPRHTEALGQVCQLHSVVLNPPPAANPPVELSAEFGPDPGAPAAARRLVVDALRGRDRGDRLLADAQLVVSELVTNAVVHAKSVFAVGIRREDSALRISVRDGNPLPPTVRDAGPAAGFGRGMRLIDTLSSGWGVDPADGGKVVWAELRI